MIGADLLILLFGLGLAGLAFLTGRVALDSAVEGLRNRALIAGALAGVFALAALVGVLEGLARLFLR